MAFIYNINSSCSDTVCLFLSSSKLLSNCFSYSSLSALIIASLSSCQVTGNRLWARWYSLSESCCLNQNWPWTSGLVWIELLPARFCLELSSRLGSICLFLYLFFLKCLPFHFFQGLCAKCIYISEKDKKMLWTEDTISISMLCIAFHMLYTNTVL